jgi:hypothetical protein
MGMFDELRCRYPLQMPNATERVFQTKSLDCVMDQFEITAEGTLRREAYEIEDHSDPNATGIMALCGMMTRVNKRWEPCSFTGEVRFYGSTREDWSDWWEFSAYFVKGALKHLEMITDGNQGALEPAATPSASAAQK